MKPKAEQYAPYTQFLPRTMKESNVPRFYCLNLYTVLNSQEKLSCQIETHGKSTQENLAQHLDSVEVNIADQVAQKSHHFFHVSFDIFYIQIICYQLAL